MLRDLDDRDYEVVLFQTPSDKLKIFVQDKLKAKYQCNQDTIINVETKKDLAKVKEVLGLVSPFSERWLVIVNVAKVGLKELCPIINASTTCTFLCITDKYKTYKALKEGIKKNNSYVELYLTYLRRHDFIYLYDALVPEDNKMSKPLFDYFVQSYSSDIEEVFDLFIALNGGMKVKTRKDISDICGIGGLTIESFIFSMVKEFPNTEKGLKKVMHNRLQAGKELSEMYKYDSLYSFMKSSISSIVQVKMLIDTGVVYKTIRNLPEGYDSMKLTRYQKYMWSIGQIPLSRFLRLADCMGRTRWHNESDFINFLYKYYLRYASDGKINLKEVRNK